ncbi:hypothetical protein Sjap_009093 [Stephania japonica]|uniref:Uncharacterized protein n=1 Tax=Stephania japonica TaxID=461633 RepID=A0AAP0JRJ0_9MAGN
MGPVVESPGVRVCAPDEARGELVLTLVGVVDGSLSSPLLGPSVGGLRCRLRRGPPAADQRVTASPVQQPSRRRKGGEPPLPSPLHGLYGVGEEELPRGAPPPPPPIRRGWGSLVGPHRPQQRQ